MSMRNHQASEWMPLSRVYDPVTNGSIDGTDTEPHDRAIIRASSVTYRPNLGVVGDPTSTIFVGRLNHITGEKTIEKTFSKYGPIKRVRLVRDIISGFSKGYAFVEYFDANDVDRAYNCAHRTLIDDCEILVDYTCARTMPGWVPRRLGGGFGGKKEAGQLRFGCRDRPFRRPLVALVKCKTSDDSFYPTSSENDTGDNAGKRDRSSKSRYRDDTSASTREDSPNNMPDCITAEQQSRKRFDNSVQDIKMELDDDGERRVERRRILECDRTRTDRNRITGRCDRDKTTTNRDRRTTSDRDRTTTDCDMDKTSTDHYRRTEFRDRTKMDSSRNSAGESVRFGIHLDTQANTGNNAMQPNLNRNVKQEIDDSDSEAKYGSRVDRTQDQDIVWRRRKSRSRSLSKDQKLLDRKRSPSDSKANCLQEKCNESKGR